MKNYYITPQLIYVALEERTEEQIHKVEYSNGGQSMSFKAHVYTNALNDNPKAFNLCGIKVKDDVLVTIPVNTPRILF
jgi:hypothetical protein